MHSSNVVDLMEQTIDKVRQMVDANTVIGTPISVGDGTTLIPISKISIGLGSGGSDIKTKTQTGFGFGGGGGAGITMSPIGFVVVSNGQVRIMPINEQASSTADRVVEMVPDLINKVSDMFENKNNQE